MELRESLAKACKSRKVGSSEVVPLGLHGDGVQHQESGSSECFSWNFAGQPHWERFLTAVIDKRYCCKCGCSGRHTTDPILEVICWSLRCITVGRFPVKRHDNYPWSGTDKSRAGFKGEFAVHGALVPGPRRLVLVQTDLLVPIVGQ